MSPLAQRAATGVAPAPVPRPRAAALPWIDVALAAALAAVLAYAEWTGRAGRHVRAAPAVERLSSPQDALGAWRRDGVRGRTLVLYARSIAMTEEPGPPTARSYLLHALDEGIVRRVHHVVPDEGWADVEAALGPRPGVERTREGFRLYLRGVPIAVVPRSAAPSVAEPALVLVEADRWSPDALGAIAAALRAAPVRSDLVLWWGADDRGPVLQGVTRATP